MNNHEVIQIKANLVPNPQKIGKRKTIAVPANLKKYLKKKGIHLTKHAKLQKAGFYNPENSDEWEDWKLLDDGKYPFSGWVLIRESSVHQPQSLYRLEPTFASGLSHNLHDYFIYESGFWIPSQESKGSTSKYKQESSRDLNPLFLISGQEWVKIAYQKQADKAELIRKKWDYFFRPYPPYVGHEQRKRIWSKAKEKRKELTIPKLGGDVFHLKKWQ